tara:strand:- start:929 stop:2326 length:1398 start_codon:yes stop_codon:yes gene_type:complete
MPLILGTNSIKDTGFDVANSLRFNAGSSDSLTKTFGTPTNNKKWTYSFWMKHCDNQGVLLNTAADTGYMYFRDSSANPVPYGFSIEQYVGGFQYKFIPNAVFRDHSAWQHIIIAFDTTQGTESNRVKIYKNGVQITSFDSATYPSQNLDTQVNSAVAHKIGGFASGANYDGYLCEVVFIDGQQLDATSFGEFDQDSGIWKPIDVSGLTFGNNGFYLDFEDSSALGNDAAGSNNFTVNNLTAVDQSIDTCTNNFPTLNPLNYSSASKTYSFGNTAITASATNTWCSTFSNFAVNSGKWYTEYFISDMSYLSAIGVGYQPFNTNTSAYAGGTILVGEDVGSAGWRNNGAAVHSYSGSSLSSWSTNDTLMIAIDMDNQKLYFGKNGTWENSGNPASGASGTGSVKDLTAGEDYLFVICPRGGGMSVNFGAPSHSISSGNTDANGYGNFEYAVPSGYFSLNTKNLAENS